MLKAIVVVIILGIFVLGYLMLGKWNGFLYHSYRSRQQKKKERESMLRIGFFNPMLYPALSVDFFRRCRGGADPGAFRAEAGCHCHSK